MKHLSLFLSILLFVSISAVAEASRVRTFGKTSVEDSDFKTLYFNQTLDHFNFKSYGEKKFQQRYLIDSQYWKSPSDPIFFYTGNEGSITSFLQASGFVMDLAAVANAMIVFAEHRYYGTSLPFGEQSFDGDNIGLLTMEQALADFAELITHLKEKNNAPNAQVITFGGSYGGQLAAYMRIRYPNLVKGALSASAPLYWITGEGDSHGFWESVTKTFSSHDGCHKVVTDGFSELASLANEGKFDEITDTFGTCQKINESNVKHLLGWIRNAFTDLAMMNYPYPTNFLAPLPGHPVKVACENAVKSGGEGGGMKGLAEISSLYYKGVGVATSNSSTCSDMFTQYVECSDPTGCGLGNDAIAWDYQACTEIVLPGGTNGKSDMFPDLPFTPEMRAQYCQKKYGVTPRTKWIGTAFWTKNLKLASNIIFSNGDLDPWGNGGIKTDLGTNLPYVEVVGGAHHFDLRGFTDEDPMPVLEARQKEALYILRWIQEI